MTVALKPRIFAVAGIPGAGKTTFIQKQILAGVFPQDAFIHDCDAVMLNLAGYQEDLQRNGPEFAFSKWELPARRLAEEALVQAVEHRQDIIYDRSCALTSCLTFIESLVKESGYELFFYFLEIDVQRAVQRTQAREQETGRHIPLSIIEDRAKTLEQLLPVYRALAAESFVIKT